MIDQPSKCRSVSRTAQARCLPMHSNIGTDLDMHMHIWQAIPGGGNVHSCYGHVVNKSSMFCSRIGNRNKVLQCVARDHPLECINSRCRSILSSMQYILLFLERIACFPDGDCSRPQPLQPMQSTRPRKPKVDLIYCPRSVVVDLSLSSCVCVQGISTGG